MTEYFNIINSTNNYLIENIEIFKNKFDTVFSFCQTKGRGRGKRNFISKNGGLYFSINLGKKENNPDILSRYTIASSLLISDFISKELKKKVYIKWPNDIFYKNKKCSGILLSFTKDNNLILGVGININNKIDKAIKRTAITLYKNNKKVNILKFALKLKDEFCKIEAYFKDENLIKKYKENNININKRIKLFSGNGELIISGKCKNFSKNGEIGIYKNKKINYFSYGEISTKSSKII